jgi:hypothetical protein
MMFDASVQQTVPEMSLSVSHHHTVMQTVTSPSRKLLDSIFSIQQEPKSPYQKYHRIKMTLLA